MANIVAFTVKELTDNLPPQMKWFEIGGQITFALYSQQMTPIARYICYLLETGVGRPTWDGKEMGLECLGVRDFGCGWRVRAIEFDYFDTRGQIIQKVVDAVNDLRPANLRYGLLHPAPNRTQLWMRYAPAILVRKVQAFIAA